MDLHLACELLLFLIQLGHGKKTEIIVHRSDMAIIDIPATKTDHNPKITINKLGIIMKSTIAKRIAK